MVLPASEIFEHCPRCAAKRATEPEIVRFVCAACGFIYYYNVAVSAGALVLDPDGYALFIRRARDPGKGKLAIPGGFVDRGENAEATVLRELREETGIVLDRVEFLASFPNLYAYGDVEYPVLDLFFIASVMGREARPLEDVSEIVWTRPAEIPKQELAFFSHVQAVRAFASHAEHDDRR
jgi:ADP-ribose pyrophosphatase YjhB (NUDIX family)